MIFREALIIGILTASYINMFLFNSHAKPSEESMEMG